MMRSQNLLLCALGALTAAALAYSSPQAPEAGTGDGAHEASAMEARFEALEREVSALKTFTEAQAAAGAELLDALARCEAEGFTAGINPKSREVLLAGLRAQASAMKAGADGKEDDANSKRVRGDRKRRRQER